MRPQLRGMLRAGYQQWRRRRMPVLVNSAGLCTKPLPPLPKCYLKLPPWVVVPTTTIHQNPHVLTELNADADAFKKLYNDDKFMEMFEEKVKWFLAANLILFEGKISDPEVSELHFQNKIRNRVLGYVTSRTLMKCLVKFREDFWMPILQALVDSRIMVLVDWDEESEMEPLEVSFFSHGQMLAPQSGTVDCETFKVETDASFYLKPVHSECGTKIKYVKLANTSSIIWNAGTMVDSHATFEIPCIDSEYAEALGVLNALRRGKKLTTKISRIVVVTDNESNFLVLTGKKDLSTCKHPEIMMAIFQAAKEYEVCSFSWEHRGSLRFVDAMCRNMRKADLGEALDVKEIMENNGPGCLWGMPMATVRQDRDEITKRMSKDYISFDEKLFSSKNYYLTVPCEELKVAALNCLLPAVDPKLVIILVASHDLAETIRDELKDSYSRVTVAGSEQAEMTEICSSNDCEAIILINDNKVPKFSTKKVLLVTCDIPTEPICYAPSQDISGLVSLNIIIPDERGFLPDAAEEVNPFMFPFFHEKTGKSGSGKKKNGNKDGSQ